jgi:hypothetical protein
MKTYLRIIYGCAGLLERGYQMCLINNNKMDICGFCRNFYQDTGCDEFALFGVCANEGSGKVLVKYGEHACGLFVDGIKSMIEQCFRKGFINPPERKV